MSQSDVMNYLYIVGDATLWTIINYVGIRYSSESKTKLTKKNLVYVKSISGKNRKHTLSLTDKGRAYMDCLFDSGACWEDDSFRFIYGKHNLKMPQEVERCY